LFLASDVGSAASLCTKKKKKNRDLHREREGELGEREVEMGLRETMGGFERHSGQQVREMGKKIKEIIIK
jgi:hypothetical protein